MCILAGRRLITWREQFAVQQVASCLAGKVVGEQGGKAGDQCSEACMKPCRMSAARCMSGQPKDARRGRTSEACCGVQLSQGFDYASTASQLKPDSRLTKTVDEQYNQTTIQLAVPNGEKHAPLCAIFLVSRHHYAQYLSPSQLCVSHEVTASCTRDVARFTLVSKPSWPGLPTPSRGTPHAIAPP